MSLIKIPDGNNQDIYFESYAINAVRKRDNTVTLIWLVGDNDPWIVSCNIEIVLSLIPDRR